MNDSTHLTYLKSSRSKSRQSSTLIVGEVHSKWHGAMQGDLEELSDEIRVFKNASKVKDYQLTPIFCACPIFKIHVILLTRHWCVNQSHINSQCFSKKKFLCKKSRTVSRRYLDWRNRFFILFIKRGVFYNSWAHCEEAVPVNN